MGRRRIDGFLTSPLRHICCWSNIVCVSASYGRDTSNLPRSSATKLREQMQYISKYAVLDIYTAE